MKHSHQTRPNTHILSYNPNLTAEFYAEVCLDWEKWFENQKEELQQRHDTYVCPFCDTENLDAHVIPIQEILGENQ